MYHKILTFVSFLPVFIFLTCAPALRTVSDSGISEIYGIVSDVHSGKPLSGVNITVKEESRSSFTDGRGLYSVKRLSAGSYTLTFFMAGYKTLKLAKVEIGPAEHYKLDVELQTVSRELNKKSSLAEEERKAMSSTRAAGKKKGAKESGDFYSTSSSDIFSSTLQHRRQSRPLKAAAHNDNEEYPFFLDYLKRFGDIKDVYYQDFSDRYIIKIVDGQDQPLFNVPFSIVDPDRNTVWEAVSHPNGESVIFPNIMFPSAHKDGLSVRIHFKGEQIKKPLKSDMDRLTTIQLKSVNRAQNLTLDLLFILDTTGSMGDEIQQLKDLLYSIHMRIKNHFDFLPVRFGLILYRDRGDRYVVKMYNFTESVEIFQRQLDAVTCEGGGDKPEDVQAALQKAVREMNWSNEAVKLSFLLADAPPHLNYRQNYTYLRASLEAAQKGIKLYTIGASGLNIPGEYIFRQISALTYSEFIFLTYGETGESEGTDEGKVSHHTGDNYESYNLDDLVVNIVKKEISYQLPEEKIARRAVDPRLQESYLKIRLENLWAQMVKQIDEFFPKDSVAVLAPFETEYNELNGLADFLQQMSVLSLTQSRRVKLVERERLVEILKEKGLTLSGLIRKEEYSDLYYLLESNFIFLGDLSFAGVDRVIFMRAVRTDTGEVVAAARIRI